MIYFDTSALVPLFVKEEKTEAIVAWINENRVGLSVSEWSLVELASALKLKRSAGHISVQRAKQALEQALEFIHLHWAIACPGRDGFRRAMDLVHDAGSKLRAGDALHLAIALSLNMQGILCLDAAMIETAQTLGLNPIAI